MIEIYINGDKVHYISNSPDFEDEIDERSTLFFRLFEPDTEKIYEEGQKVEVGKDGELAFVGFIKDSKFSNVARENDGGYSKIWEIECIDNHYLADKRVIAFAEENIPCGDAVKRVVDYKLEEEGVYYASSYDLSQDVNLQRELDLQKEFDLKKHFHNFFDYFFGIERTADSIEDGPEIEEAVFNYVSCNEVLDALAEKANFWWKIDKDRALHFKSRETNKAPFDLYKIHPDTNEVIIYGEPEVEYNNPKYRNTQYIKGGRDITDEQTERKKGDGESRSFTLGFAIAKEPTIEVSRDGGESWEKQTVGRKGTDDEAQFYWEKGDNTIKQDDDETVLDDEDDRLRVTYRGEFDIVAMSEDPEEIHDRKQAEENTSGIVEHAAQDDSVGTRESGIELASSKIEKWGQNSKKITYRTEKNGLEAGQIQNAHLPEYFLDEEELLITKVNLIQEDTLEFWEITAVVGPNHGSWTKFFLEQDRKAEIKVREDISEDQILIVPIEFEKNWEEDEHPNIFKEVYPDDDLYPSDDLYPMFDPEDRVKFLAWYDGETELGRKEYTQQDGADSDEIFTLTYLGPSEANVEITDFRWIGGWEAKEDEAESGVVIDKQEYEAEKTELEAWQVEKTDNKWS